MNPHLDHLQQSSKLVMGRNAKSFYFASQIFSEEVLAKVSLLYSFCRFVDDCADEGSQEGRKKNLEILSHYLNAKKKTPWPLFEERVETIVRFGVERKSLSILVDGGLFDNSQGIVKNDNDLIYYCFQVAGVVGLMMCPLIGVRDGQAKKHALHMGIAMQLTNISRDVVEDYKNNRSYIPADWLAESASSGPLSLEILTQPPFIRRLLNLADEYYLSGRQGLAYIPFRPRLAILVASEVYRAIGTKIRRNGYDISSRVFLSTAEKIWVSIKALRWTFRLSFWRTKNLKTFNASLFLPKKREI